MRPHDVAGMQETRRIGIGAPAVERMDQKLIERLETIATVKRDEPLSRYTTFGIGGPADVLATVRSADELAAAVSAAREAGTPWFVLGAGSNILVSDRGIRGVVIDNQAKATRITPMPDEPGRFVVWCESGTPFASLARNLSRRGYAGVEWACGIPGTMGGAAVYNAGAYGGCLADVLIAVTLLDADAATRHLPAAALRMAYRTSAILRGELGHCVVLTLELAVARGDTAALTQRIAELDAQRLDAQPRGRNSGSTFKNPPGRQAWELIDSVGLRGHRIGNAQISEKHCNFIENLGGATAADVHGLMREAQRRVKERYGIDLENEVELVGEGFA